MALFFTFTLESGSESGERAAGIKMRFVIFFGTNALSISVKREISTAIVWMFCFCLSAADAFRLTIVLWKTTTVFRL